MADTLSLDTAVQFVIARGAQVRLIGDDQQLAAIGAGGVLRDIAATHGALHLTELLRFTDPAEAAASLALRDGAPEALGFYLDHGRVHVGDLATTTEDAFTAWVSDRAAGLDAIMLAPTRDLVAELNQRARAHRLDSPPAGSEVRLADGNRASVGDVIITRSNDRRLRLTATDWVKNGDRWTVTDIDRRGDLTVRHTRSHRTVRLPADYVATSTGLGYATTIHAAQGVTADTMHGLLTGDESRQQLYTMLTRGPGRQPPLPPGRRRRRPARPHPTRHRLHRAPPPTSWSESSPATKPPSQPPRFCENSATRPPGSSMRSSATSTASTSRPSNSSDRRPWRRSIRVDQIIPGLSSEPSWPTLRAHLLTLAAQTGQHPLLDLQTAADERDLGPRVTWPRSSTGASQSPHRRSRAHCLGYPAFHQHFKIIPAGANTWRSGHSS